MEKGNISKYYFEMIFGDGDSNEIKVQFWRRAG